MISKLKNIYDVYGYYYFKLWTLHFLVLSSVFFIDIKYFLYSLIVYLVVAPLMVLVNHDYVSHEYVRPKNQWIELFCLFLMYIHDTNVQTKRIFHVNHHRKWYDPTQDPTCQKMQGVPVWRYILGFQRPVEQQLDPVKNISLLNNKWVQFFDQDYRKIYWAYIILMLVALPMSWFFVVCIYFPWVRMLISNSHDQVFHGKLQSNDHTWYLPFYSSGSWHIQHHKQYAHGYHGPGIWKWLNLAWYYQLLLFDDHNSDLE